MKKEYLLPGIIVIGIVAAGLTWIFSSNVRIAVEARMCTYTNEKKAEQIDCWYTMLSRELRDRGVTGAMKAFIYLYETQPLLTDSGCHRHAHKVGDMAYFQLYLNDPSLDSLEFPPETTSCTYGFYHGFFEHYFQDHPDAGSIKRTCDYFIDRTSDYLPSIRNNCYHGSGHGILLAHAETVPKSSWGNSPAFLSKPLGTCLGISKEENDVQECMQGIFTVFVNWMVDGEYGFSYDLDDPFSVCRTLSWLEQRMCYHQFLEKLAGAYGFNEKQLADAAEQIPEREWRDVAYVAATSVLVQNMIRDDSFTALTPRCLELRGEFAPWCIRGIVLGLFNFGEPQVEYERALVLCTSQLLAGPAREACYRQLATGLDRLYPKKKRLEICEKFPTEYSHMCSG